MKIWEVTTAAGADTVCAERIMVDCGGLKLFDTEGNIIAAYPDGCYSKVRRIEEHDFARMSDEQLVRMAAGQCRKILSQEEVDRMFDSACARARSTKTSRTCDSNIQKVEDKLQAYADETDPQKAFKGPFREFLSTAAAEVRALRDELAKVRHGENADLKIKGFKRKNLFCALQLEVGPDNDILSCLWSTKAASLRLDAACVAEYVAGKMLDPQVRRAVVQGAIMEDEK